MPKIPVHIAEKLLQLAQGEVLPASSVRHDLMEELILEGIVVRKGRIQKRLSIVNSNALQTYLQNRYSINNLQKYIQTLNQENVSRSELVIASSDSKSRKVRTFRGFLVNCYCPIQATINGKQITIDPVEGTFQFIYDFEKFILSPNITIVGIENPENFRYIEKQKYLFNDLNPLFICRYPQNQSKDLRRWLQSIANPYLHFGDFDFAGIGIYLNEYKKYLGNRASFFVPENMDEKIEKHGNKDLYAKQKINFDKDIITEEKLLKLIKLIHKYKKGLEQEIFVV
jgi:hypothetical protein